MKLDEKTSLGLNEGLESVESEVPAEEPAEKPDEGPVTLEKLYGVITKQNNAILMLTGKLVGVTQTVEALKEHEGQIDKAIVEVAKKVGVGGGGAGGAQGLLAQILPFLTQSKGPGPLEKIAMQSFLRTMAFASLTTERIAKRQYGDEYTKMVREMEEDIAGTFVEKPE